MISIYVSFGVIILYSLNNLTVAKPFDEEKSFSNEKLNCMDSNEGLDYEKNNPNSYSDYYRPRSRFEGSDKYSNRPFEFDKKRATGNEFSDNFATGSLQKRQVGVVYKDEKPIGILQPYQRSYRFIPVKEEDNLYEINNNQQASPFNVPSVTDIDKREVNLDPAQMDGSYPSILTNFKIVNKLDKKRNYDALTDENVRDLKATIRRLRSSNSRNNEQIEEELKNILDDMGLIDDDEIHGEKREISEEQAEDENEPLSDDEMRMDKERNKREEACNHGENTDTNNKAISEQNFLSSEEKRMDAKNEDFGHASFNKRENDDVSKEAHRKKRQKQETGTGSNKENSELVENLKDMGDLMVSGNKSPLASSSDIVEREVETKETDKKSEDDDDYERRVEREIQNKISSLKEEVKREIEALKKRQNDEEDEDTQRKKRQVYDNLINEETDELNPALNPEGELKPLVRKRRAVKKDGIQTVSVRKKRESTADRKQRRSYTSNMRNSQKNYKVNHEGNDEGDLLGGDDSEEGRISKRQVYTTNYENINNGKPNLNPLLYERSKRSGLNDLGVHDNYLYNDYSYDKNGRLKRQNVLQKNSHGETFRRRRFIPFKRGQWRSRFRRRINENQVAANRPQQLSDMSDLDLFGALPKSYDGELSRYKRVK